MVQGEDGMARVWVDRFVDRGLIRADELSSPIGAAEFKARCLQIMDQVNETGAEVTITKHGRPVAKLVPVTVAVARPPLIGACKESLVIVGEHDLVPSTAGEWDEWDTEIEYGRGISDAV